MRPARRIRLVLAAAAAAAACALLAAGCGLGPGKSPTGVSLTVTRDFGTRTLKQARRPHVSGTETVMRLLMRNARVGTAYGGGFVQSIDGLSGGGSGGHVDWFYYVNGVQGTKGAAATDVHPGDSVWWDRHDWKASETIPAVVGSFPQPFLGGVGGRRLPVRIECASGAVQKACGVVSQRLAAYGIPAAEGSLRTSVTEHTLRVLVGPWAAVSEDPAIARMQDGPDASGVYAEPAPAGHTIALLDPLGHTVRTLGAGGGLIAATQVEGDPPIWTVSGTDTAGVNAAANAFSARVLKDRFAVAVAPGGALVPLPEDPAR
ncbi:MAG TPA: DUF4430 domain-containing protein [Solirubrobacteraceae bacterium]|nr:DUF4430 domain-containing protein [Solirubrobacteraceae bacterium]